MKKIITVFILFFISIISVKANTFVNTNIDGFKIKAVKLEKNSGYKLILGVSEKGESLGSFVDRYNGVSGVNGAYFCPADYKDCGGENIARVNRINNGVSFSKTGDDTGADWVMFALDKEQNPFLFRKNYDYTTGRNDTFFPGKTINLDKQSSIYNGLSNHPLLIQDGIDKLGESNTIDTKMKSKGLKNFICSTKDGNTIYMGGVENITIYQVPLILSKLGCYNALNLDSGGSTSMIYNNKYIKGPGRNIMDAWIIVPDKFYPIKDEDIKKEKIILNFKSSLDKLLNNISIDKKNKILSKLKNKLDLIIKNTKNENKKLIYTDFKKEIDLRIY